MPGIVRAASLLMYFALINKEYIQFYSDISNEQAISHARYHPRLLRQLPRAGVGLDHESERSEIGALC